MIIVIQCAGRKQPNAGCFEDKNGKAIMFVANPNLAPPHQKITFVRPDDESDIGISWRNKLVEYNETPSANPLNLLSAWQLYKNKTYQKLVNKFGLENVYILSAGWGLISASFLTPNYDITFSASAEKSKRRRKKDIYNDLCMLPSDCTEKIIFLGGKDYIPLFCALTSHIQSKKIIFYNSAIAPIQNGFETIRFATTTRTNWHYECANALIDDEIVV